MFRLFLIYPFPLLGFIPLSDRLHLCTSHYIYRSCARDKRATVIKTTYKEKANPKKPIVATFPTWQHPPHPVQYYKLPYSPPSVPSMNYKTTQHNSNVVSNMPMRLDQEIHYVSLPLVIGPRGPRPWTQWFGRARRCPPYPIERLPQNYPPHSTGKHVGTSI